MEAILLMLSIILSLTLLGLLIGIIVRGSWKKDRVNRLLFTLFLSIIILSLVAAWWFEDLPPPFSWYRRYALLLLFCIDICLCLVILFRRVPKIIAEK